MQSTFFYSRYSHTLIPSALSITIRSFSLVYSFIHIIRDFLCTTPLILPRRSLSRKRTYIPFYFSRSFTFSPSRMLYPLNMLARVRINYIKSVTPHRDFVRGLITKVFKQINRALLSLLPASPPRSCVSPVSARCVRRAPAGVNSERRSGSREPWKSS